MTHELVSPFLNHGLLDLTARKFVINSESWQISIKFRFHFPAIIRITIGKRNNVNSKARFIAFRLKRPLLSKSRNLLKIYFSLRALRVLYQSGWNEKDL